MRAASQSSRAVVVCLALLHAVALPVSVVHRFAGFFQFGHFVGAQHLGELAFGALIDGFHLGVSGFAGDCVAALAGTAPSPCGRGLG